MKESVCHKILDKNTKENIICKLKEYNYPTSNIYFNVLVDDSMNYKYHNIEIKQTYKILPFNTKIKIIDNEGIKRDRYITIYDKDWYEVGKQIGRDFKLDNLIKCWEGAE